MPELRLKGLPGHRQLIEKTILNAANPNETRAASRALAEFLAAHKRVSVLTGAGLSTASGIPDYRDEDGNWKHTKPMQFADFLGSEKNRQRYWSRSFAGWERIGGAVPNDAHRAIARLEKAGRVTAVITQNVDNLHRAAGSDNVIDLHGVLHKVRCLDCNAVVDRRQFQEWLQALNPGWQASASIAAPDGDARIPAEDVARFRVPACRHCDGVLKPDVVFFGESVPAERVAMARREVGEADALLVIGSSLMVYSGYRFVRQAAGDGKPIAIVNRGRTRADEFAAEQLRGDCVQILAGALQRLAA